MQTGKLFFSGFAKVINAMRKCPKLVIARVQGKTVGGGVGLVAACDYAMATEAAAIKLSELSIGIGPFVIAPAVERKMGKAALAELTLGAHEWKNAYWAKEKGLYARVFDNLKELDEEVIFFAEKLASYNPEALLEMKNYSGKAPKTGSNYSRKMRRFPGNWCYLISPKRHLKNLKNDVLFQFSLSFNSGSGTE